MKSNVRLPEKSSAGRQELDVRDAVPLGFVSSGAEHGWRPIDGGHRSGVSGGSTRQRNDEPAGTAAVLQDGAGIEVRAQLQLDRPEHRRDERIAALEEGALVFGREVLAQELRRGEDREVRFSSSEAFPAWIGIVRHRSLRLHGNPRNHVADLQRLDDLFPVSHLAEDGVLPVEVRPIRQRHVELTVGLSRVAEMRHARQRP